MAAPILGLGLWLSLYALGDGVMFFYTPSQIKTRHLPAGRSFRIGGLVVKGSVRQDQSGNIAFQVTDKIATENIFFHGLLPDLFREGQGVVAQGQIAADGRFIAREVLAKHDERYMPSELVQALKKSGRWQEGTDATIAASPSLLAKPTSQYDVSQKPFSEKQPLRLSKP